MALEFSILQNMLEPKHDSVTQLNTMLNGLRSHFKS